MLNKHLKKHNFCVTLHLSMVAHICHGKTKNLTAKPNTSQQKQNSFDFAVGIWFCREVFGFAVRYFVFAVRLLVLQ